MIMYLYNFFSARSKNVQPPWSVPEGTEVPKLKLYNSLTRQKVRALTPTPMHPPHPLKKSLTEGSDTARQMFKYENIKEIFKISISLKVHAMYIILEDVLILSWHTELNQHLTKILYLHEVRGTMLWQCSVEMAHSCILTYLFMYKDWSTGGHR